MRNFIYILSAFLLLSCTTTKYVPVVRVKTVTTTVTDTFVEVVTPPERVVNTTTDTISVLSTRYATSTAEVSNGVLRHEITQHARKDSVKTQTIYIHEADSIPYPVEVETVREVVPTWCWWTLLIAGVAVGGIVLLIIGRIKKN